MASLHVPKTRSRSSIRKLPHTSFFRIILPYILQLNKLKLPLKFVRRYGSELSSTAKLCLPNGHEWNVGVEKNMKGDGNKKDEIWLSEGWGEFMEHHSISKGFILVFKYRGYSVFDVEIFDLTTCSISYPPPPAEESTGFSNIVVISDDEDEEDDKFGGGDEMEKTLERLKSSGVVTDHWLKARIRKMHMKCKKGIEDAIVASNPTYPNFIIVLSSNQIRCKSRPVIPILFAREHILKGGNGGTTSTTVVLQMGEGAAASKQWIVELVKRRRRVNFGPAGWRQFNDDNNLREGDVCLFHLVSPVDLVFNVSIFPTSH